ncbi:MAG: MFS transporter [Acidimicrobiaceae bacterium]|nr:MFS transporter [Acidimicrobiaceae bacterium]|tara:strand:- start:59 stop:655 length:597 start_codon:yes stop_codon:yes gene_type:complete
MDSQSHYFDEEPDVLSRKSTVDLVLPDITTTLTTDKGVFSSQRVDSGTNYLLQNAPIPKTVIKSALDLGCGYGPIARTLVHRFPEANIFAIDVNLRALSLAEENLGDLGVSVLHPDSVDRNLQFDLIWSNPPIRIGKSKLYDLLETWLSRLTTHGEAILVVQKHLGADSLSGWLNKNEFQAEKLSSKSGYRLIKVTKK